MVEEELLAFSVHQVNDVWQASSVIVDDLAHLATDVDKLRLLPSNPRRGNVDAVARSLEAFGQRKPIVALSDGTVIAGNHTLQAARQLGWQQIAVVRVEDDDATAKAYALADNKTAELGDYDEELLAQLVAELAVEAPDLVAATAWSDAEVDSLLASLEVRDELTDPDDVPEPPNVAVTKPGDVWLLGTHRLVCGDSTDAAVVATAVDGRKADMVWTDPPYGVSYTAKNAMLNARDGGSRMETGIQSDELDYDHLVAFLRKALNAALAESKPGSSWWVAAPGMAQPLLAFATVLVELGVWRHTLVWVKDGFVLGRSDYHGRHEQLLYGWAPGATHRPPPDRSQDSVWEVPRPRKNDLHPTMKPVALITRAVENHTNRNDLVLDVFGGSGSTLIAAHDTGRVAALVELDPIYCDVICRRFQEHTSVVPVLETTGESVSFSVNSDD